MSLGSDIRGVIRILREGKGPMDGWIARAYDRGVQDAFRELLPALTADLLPNLAGARKIVDVGCGPEGLAAFEPGADITGLDAVERPDYPGRRFLRGDARALPFEPGSFDIAYCNSLVEHLHPADRRRFADQIRRVARRYWIQTPNRYFPVEPHVLLPGFQFLPEAARRRLWRVGMPRTPYEEIELLNAAELRELFPDAVILRERVAGLTKSLIAAGPADSVQASR
jgi:SAM-dependent methyltransferase